MMIAAVLYPALVLEAAEVAGIELVEAKFFITKIDCVVVSAVSLLRYTLEVDSAACFELIGY